MEPDGICGDININNVENDYLFPYLPEEFPDHPIPESYTLHKIHHIPLIPDIPDDFEFESEADFLSNFDFSPDPYAPIQSFPRQPYQQSKPIMNFSEISEEDTKHTESSSAYCEKLKTLRVIMKETRFLEFSARETVLGPGALARVTKELKVLATSLPCEAGGSIFCSFISSNLSLAEALISGPEDTPYEHGLYLFSIQIPSEYPKSPPIVQILTTGNGMIRFNPNLYNNGYVCLSIINTWGGSPQERWNPTFSTLLQVLISIQALVMDCKVVQKEPGFEYYPENSQENKAYSWCVRYGNMTYAVLENLKNPPKAFSEVVQKHFYMKKSQILATLEKWLEEAKNADLDWNSAIVLNHNRQTMALFMEKGLYNVFAALYGQIREQLDSLDSV